MSYDETEQYAADISEREGVNIAAERVSGEYNITIGPNGQPRRHYQTLSPAMAHAFLDGVLAGITMLQCAIEDSNFEDDEEECEECRATEALSDEEMVEYILERVGDQVRCPDCDSDVSEPVHTPSGAWYMEVRHSETCPIAKKWNNK